MLDLGVCVRSVDCGRSALQLGVAFVGVLRLQSCSSGSKGGSSQGWLGSARICQADRAP